MENLVSWWKPSELVENQWNANEKEQRIVVIEERSQRSHDKIRQWTGAHLGTFEYPTVDLARGQPFIICVC